MHPSEWPSLPAFHACQVKKCRWTEPMSSVPRRGARARCAEIARARAARAAMPMGMAWGIAWRKNTCRVGWVVVYAPSGKRL